MIICFHGGNGFLLIFSRNKSVNITAIEVVCGDEIVSMIFCIAAIALNIKGCFFMGPATFSFGNQKLFRLLLKNFDCFGVQFCSFQIELSNSVRNISQSTIKIFKMTVKIMIFTYIYLKDMQ